MSLSARVDRFLFDEYRASPESLAAFRIIYAVCVLTVYLPKDLWIAAFPSSFFNPPIGLTIFFSGFPPSAFFVALDAAAVVAACCVLVGYRTFAASLALAALLMVGEAWANSFGLVNDDILVVLVPLCLAFAGWGEAYSVDARREPRADEGPQAWPLALLALAIGFAMMTGAEAKATTGWLDPETHAVRAHLLRNAVVVNGENRATSALLRIDSGSFWESLDYATVALEGAFLFTAFRRRAFRVVCAFGCLFHLGIAVTMGIPYWPNVLAYGAFFDWSWLASRPGRPLARADGPFALVTPPRLLAFGLALAVLYVAVGNPVVMLSEAMVSGDPLKVYGFPPVMIGAILASVFLVGEAGRARRESLPAAGSAPVVLFDGLCALCDSWVDFLLRRDRDGIYRFAALQSPEGETMLARANLSKGFDDSIVLVEGDRVFFGSSAVLRMLRAIGLPFSLTYAFILVPRPIRDAVYAFVAERRTRWFGRRESCRVPTAEERARFL